MWNASFMPVWRMMVGCQKPMAYEPISMPKKMAPSSQTRGLVNTERTETWALRAASSLISAATVARSRSESHLASTTRLSKNKKMIDAEEDCGYGLQDEEPLPSGDALAACEVRRMKPERGPPMIPDDGVSGHQQRNHCGAAMRREPVGEVKNHAGKESGFRNSQQQARGSKTA